MEFNVVGGDEVSKMWDHFSVRRTDIDGWDVRHRRIRVGSGAATRRCVS